MNNTNKKERYVQAEICMPTLTPTAALYVYSLSVDVLISNVIQRFYLSMDGKIVSINVQFTLIKSGNEYIYCFERSNKIEIKNKHIP